MPASVQHDEPAAETEPPGRRRPDGARPRRRRRNERAVLSPLRYPGGKRRLVPYVAAALASNDLRPELFVEPFCGGASVALELAENGAVEQIALADSDPLVAAFWRVVFDDSDWLCAQVEEQPVTLELWSALKNSEPADDRSRAWACLVLNRTSFNGSLHPRSGPIGGRAQAGEYDIACRFPRARLVSRIQACAQLAAQGRVAWVRCEDAVAVLRAEDRRSGAFFYLDPPFWAKSDRLYRHGFAQADHEDLAFAIGKLTSPWLLSYDPAPEISELYAEHDARVTMVELLYTGSQRCAGHELVVSSLWHLPPDTKLWRTNAEWLHARRRERMGMVAAPEIPAVETARTATA